MTNAKKRTFSTFAQAWQYAVCFCEPTSFVVDVVRSMDRVLGKWQCIAHTPALELPSVVSPCIIRSDTA